MCEGSTVSNDLKKKVKNNAQNLTLLLACFLKYLLNKNAISNRITASPFVKMRYSIFWLRQIFRVF